MNDRAVCVLDEYDFEVRRVIKGRGSLVCDTSKGSFVLKEYNGMVEKLELLDRLQGNMCSISPRLETDNMVRNKNGRLYSRDEYGTAYIVKKNIEGRDCNNRSEEDICEAFRAMAYLHKSFRVKEDTGLVRIHYYADDMKRHTTECRRVRNYIKKQNCKSDFERKLLKHYDYFLDSADNISSLAGEESRELYEEYVEKNGMYCHGDYQYHNVRFAGEKQKNRDYGQSVAIINFEHFAHDTGARDIYLLLRKVMEKNDWSENKAHRMLEAYQSVRSIPDIEWRCLALRLAYPEKFWKIVNFYANSRKSWISDRNYDKLETLIAQEKSRQRLLKNIFGVG